MNVSYLQLFHFRHFKSVELETHPYGAHYIYGHNGCGKTSLLEAIYYLSLGRSFRTALSLPVIHEGADKLSIFSRLTNENRSVSVGLERTLRGDLSIRMDGADVKTVSVLTSLLPVQVIDTHCHALLEEGPSYRRQYLDWGLFYSNPRFLAAWRDYNRILKQRNAALRAFDQGKSTLDSWTHQLLASAAELDQMRREYVAHLTILLHRTVPQLIDLPELCIEYCPGWEKDKAYATVLSLALNQDIQRGYTQYGPHKADLKIYLKKTFAKDFLSRGQQKLLVCAMIIARGLLLQATAQTNPVYLVDDLPAELDASNRIRLMDLLFKQKTQLFVTAIEPDCKDYSSNIPIKMFHVKHQAATEVECFT